MLLATVTSAASTAVAVIVATVVAPILVVVVAPIVASVVAPIAPAAIVPASVTLILATTVAVATRGSGAAVATVSGVVDGNGLAGGLFGLAVEIDLGEKEARLGVGEGGQRQDFDK
jgi:hypothetical protein